VQALRFVEVGRWFPPQRDPRASEGFYTPLHEDFYRAYVDSGIASDLRESVDLRL
jgi:hypothetical protein